MIRQANGKPRSSQVDIGSPLEHLMQIANKQGYLLLDDLLAAIPHPEEDLAQVEEIFIQLVHQGITIFSDETEATEENPKKATSPVETDLDPSDLTQVPVDDITTLYLKEMGQVALLTAAEEIALAKRLARGHQAEEQLRRATLVSTEIETLEKEVQEGQKSRDHLIKANTRLVVSIAKKYRNQGVPFCDLIQEGNLGLMRAVEKFDYRRGFKFSTYASWWIRQAITRTFADQSRIIRIPVYLSDRIRKLHYVTDHLEQVLGRRPNVEEVAQEMNIEPEMVHWLLRVTQLPLSLEQPVSEDEGSDELYNFIEDEEASIPPDIADNHLLREQLENVLATLTPREARIIRLRFGLQNGRYHTLEEVGQKFGLTRERIRQIEAEALRKLRHPRRTRQLRDYLD